MYLNELNIHRNSLYKLHNIFDDFLVLVPSKINKKNTIYDISVVFSLTLFECSYIRIESCYKGKDGIRNAGVKYFLSLL